MKVSSAATSTATAQYSSDDGEPNEGTATQTGDYSKVDFALEGHVCIVIVFVCEITLASVVNVTMTVLVEEVTEIIVDTFYLDFCVDESFGTDDEQNCNHQQNLHFR
ncbi:Uncharacterised protein g1529 [Pycnogonum litorale]